MSAPVTEFPDAKIYLVDDDAGVREALGWLLRTRRLVSDGYDSAEAFLAEAAVDVRMSGMSGLALFEQLRELPWQAAMPIIFLSGHADVATAVDAVKRGAFDFCEKPFSDNALVDRVEHALRRSASELAQRATQRGLQQRLDSLTERERDVMNLVVAGLPNKLVADQLQISVRTVEVHRSRVFDKMGVKSAVELANLLRGA
jgi:two-component system, LuxR family, response regulator DctR